MPTPNAMNPASYLKHTLRLFPAGTMVLMVTPRDGHWQADLEGCVDTNVGEALEIMAAAHTILQRQTSMVIAAAAEQTGKTQEETLEYFQALCERQSDDTEQDHQVSTTVQDRPKGPPAALPGPKLMLAGAVRVCRCVPQPNTTLGGKCPNCGLSVLSVKGRA